MTNAIGAFIFDIGGVLLDYDLDLLAARVADGSSEIRAKVLGLRDDPSLRQVESGEISGRQYFERHIRPLAPRMTYRDLIQAWADVFTVNREGMALFAALRARRLPVYLLSNLADFNAVAIETKVPGFLAQSGHNFFSFELGCIKPEPEVYLKVCAHLGVQPDQCFFLDDTLACVAGARRVGMAAEYFTPSRVAAIRKRISALIGSELA